MDAKAILEQIEHSSDLRFFITKEQLKYLREHCAKDMPSKPAKAKAEEVVTPDEGEEDLPSPSRPRRTRKS